MNNTKTAFIALVGRPNVGKSTLLNAIIGEKVAIVSDKPQTTRNRITGILTQEETQLVFLDTPGWHNPHTRLSDFMVQEVKQSLADIEVALLLTDPLKKVTPEEEELLKTLTLRKIPTILVINKIDTLKQKDMMIPKIQAFSELFHFDEVIPISAKNHEGVDTLLKIVKNYAKKGPHFFEPDDYTDQPERVIVAEMIREKLLRNLWEELPHGIAVGVDRMEERENGKLIDIDATIFTEKASHKGMIIGKRGAMLKKVGSEARAEIERFLGCPVNLQCWVKVKEDWRNRDNLMKQFGFNS